jgi:hypothetical protein
MSDWCLALVLIAVAGSAGCREETALPSRAAAPPATMSSTPAPDTMPPATAEPPASTTATVDTQAPRPPVMNAPKPKPSGRVARKPVKSFAVYALSRGKGVPPEAREALRRVVQLADEDQRRGVKVVVMTARIGLEGETRVCFAYEDPQEGARACERARAVVENVDLVNLAVEPCEKAANNQQEKEP